MLTGWRFTLHSGDVYYTYLAILRGSAPDLFFITKQAGMSATGTGLCRLQVTIAAPWIGPALTRFRKSR